MTHTSIEQPEALMRLADNYAEACFDQGLNQRTTDDKPETEREKLEKAIRRMHTRISELEAQLSAIGAGGVEPMHNREASAALAASDERKAFDAANLRDYFGGPLSYRERDIAFMAWQARAALAATPVADAGNPALESDVSVALPEPAAWLATFTPKGVLSPHSIAGTNLEELKLLVPSDSVFKPLYTCHVSQELEQFIEQMEDVHFQRCRVGSKEGAIRWDIEFGHYGAKVRDKTLRDAITKAIAAQAKQGAKK